MTTSDLVSRLLEAIAERVRKTEACIAEVGSDRVGDEYADGSGTAERDDFPSYPWGSAENELAFMAGPGHPDDVLRLCQALREIVSLHPAGEGGDSYLCAVCHLDGQSEDCTYPCDTVRALARGYGIEDGED